MNFDLIHSSYTVSLATVCALIALDTAALGQQSAAYVQEYVKASNTGENDAFGGAAAIDGDTFAVGARGEASGWPPNQNDNSQGSAGAVYVYERNGGQWAQSAFLKALNAQTNDRFGDSIALDGDTLVIGASHEDGSFPGVVNNPIGNPALQDNGLMNAGAVYVFERTGSNWVPSAYIKASNPEAGDRFGLSVDLHGDLLVVGAAWESSDARGVNGDQSNNLAMSSGAAYVFRRTGLGWAQEAYLKSSNSDAGDFFGGRVSAGQNRLAIGAFQEDSAGLGQDHLPFDNSAQGAGAVYVFGFEGGAWSQEAYLKPFNTDAGDWFGRSLALSGTTLVVGATEESSESVFNPSDNSSPSSGAAYVFERGVQSWFQVAYLKVPNQDAFDRLGTEVAIHDDAIVVSALAEDGGVPGVQGNGQDNSIALSGAAYYFERLPAGWTFLNYVKSFSPGPADNFGRSVALDDRRMLIGAWNEDSSATGIGGDFVNNSTQGAGAAFLYGVDGILPGAFCGPAVPHSLGFPAQLGASGSRIAVENSVQLTAIDLPPGQFGFFLNSRGSDFIPTIGGSEGTLCLGGGSAIGRHNAPSDIQNSGPFGSFTLELDLTQLPGPMGTQTVMAGETWHFQAWFRDQNPMATSNLTNGYRVLFE